MKKTILAAISLFAATLCSAQQYIVDCPWPLPVALGIRDGDTVTVTKRCTMAKYESLPTAGDIRGIVEIDGKEYPLRAQWLIPLNPDNDIFAADTFFNAIPHLREHIGGARQLRAPEGKALYNPVWPIAALLCMYLAIAWPFLVPRLARSLPRAANKFVCSLSVVPFYLSVGIVCYLLYQLGDDATWWCDTDCVPLPYAYAGGALLGLYVTGAYVFSAIHWAFAEISIKPALITYLIAAFTAGIGIPLLLIPLIIGFVKGRFYGILTAATYIVQIHFTLVMLAVFILAGFKILIVSGAAAILAIFIGSALGAGRISEDDPDEYKWRRDSHGGFYFGTRSMFR